MKVYAIDPSDEYDDEDIDEDDDAIEDACEEEIFEKKPEAPTPPAQVIFAAAVPLNKESDRELKGTREDAQDLDYDAIYTYCEVAFYEGGKCFHYRTENSDLKVGDQVYVPVGYRNEKRIGTIVSIENYVGHEAPFPLEKTKMIIGKVE